MWDWGDPEFLAVFIAFITVIGGAVQYIWNKHTERREQHFDQYHKIIKYLVEREEENKPMMLDRQIALIYELRNFESYYPVTRRILMGLKDTWQNYGPELKRERLFKELDLTINHTEKFLCKNCKDSIV